jgi:hypothetical protein
MFGSPKKAARSVLALPVFSSSPLTEEQQNSLNTTENACPMANGH